MIFPNGTESERLLFYIYAAEPDYYDLMDMEFAAGGPYPDTREPLDPHIIINETLAREMGYVNLEDAIGGQPEFWGRPWTISGVIRDYHHFGLKEAIRPMVIGQRSTFDKVVVRLNPQAVSMASLPGMLDKLEETWTSVFPQSTVNLTFLDQQFEAQYREDRKFETAFAIFTGLGIFIAALGLFGLTAYTCLQRQKEIGIRKVSGASVMQILALLNKDFLRWVVLAFGLGAPIGWYIMNRWLQEFAYRTSLSWWVILAAGAAALGIALISVSFQALKAATQNPVNSLRTE